VKKRRESAGSRGVHGGRAKPGGSDGKQGEEIRREEGKKGKGTRSEEDRGVSESKGWGGGKGWRGGEERWGV
jgi:hypothetical protein